MRYHWIIDAGHGYNTPGKRSPLWSDGTQLFEYEYNRAIAHALAGMCFGGGITATLLVPEWHDVPLSERVRRVNDMETNAPKVLVSIHGNAASATAAHGFEVFTSLGNTQSDPIADTFVDALELEFEGERIRKDMTDGDQDKEANFYILRHTRCPAILTENGFFTNRQQCADMLTGTWRQRVALAHYKAMILCESKPFL
jgi:N-acetylmuramoyl-L-alanine amidase